MPAWEAAALIVIEAEFAFQVLVHAFGAPALLEAMDELAEGHPLVGREVEVERRVLPVAPLADQPDAIAFSRLTAIVGSGHDAQEGEPGAQRLAGTFTPRVATKAIGGDELLRESAGSDGLAASAGMPRRPPRRESSR